MPSILIVDDEEDIRELIAVNLLREENYKLTQAVNGLDALEKARSDRPDLIILDLMLPEMDGLTVYKTIREDARTKDIPVIMLTALGRLEEKIEGLQLGADDYLSKPFSPKELMLRVRNIFRRANLNTGVMWLIRARSASIKARSNFTWTEKKSNSLPLSSNSS